MITVVVVRGRVTTTARVVVTVAATVAVPCLAAVAARVACVAAAVAEERARANSPDRRVAVAVICANAESARTKVLPMPTVGADRIAAAA